MNIKYIHDLNNGLYNLYITLTENLSFCYQDPLTYLLLYISIEHDQMAHTCSLLYFKLKSSVSLGSELGYALSLSGDDKWYLVEITDIVVH